MIHERPTGRAQHQGFTHGSLRRREEEEDLPPQPCISNPQQSAHSHTIAMHCFHLVAASIVTKQWFVCFQVELVRTKTNATVGSSTQIKT